MKKHGNWLEKNLEKLHEGEEAPRQGIHPRFETGQASLEVQNRTRGINGPQKTLMSVGVSRGYTDHHQGRGHP